MNAVVLATKRLWSRRLGRTLGASKNFGSWIGAKIKALWEGLKIIGLCLIALPLVIPIEIWIIATFVTVPAVTIGHAVWLDMPASPNRIKAVLAIDACVENTLPRRAAAQNEPLSNHDVSDTIKDCEQYWEDQANIAKQAEALKGK
jgi:hypothetical protein